MTGFLQAGIVLLAILSMSPVLRNDFVDYDDGAYVTDNPRVQAGLTVEGFSWAWTTRHAANWHPLTWLSHMFDAQLWGERPVGHHLMSLLLHAANALLLFTLLQGMTSAWVPSAIAAALFAIHPLHVESVAWVAERKDLLSSFFGLLAIAAYVRWTRRPQLGTYALAVLLHAASLCSKPMLVTLPFVLLLIDFWPLGRFRRVGLARLVYEKLPFFALAAASAVVTLLAQSRGGALWTLQDLPFEVRALHAIVAYPAYLWKTVWPVGLAVIYPHPAGAPALWKVGISVVLLTAITVCAVRERTRRPHLFVGWLWFIGTLVPVIGLVQVGAQAIADRYTYVPLIGIFIAVAWETARDWGRGSTAGGLRVGTVPVVVLGVVLLTLGVLTFRQAGRWKDSETLFTHALAVTHRNVIAALMLGAGLQGQGRHEEAVAWMRRAVEMSPGAAWARRFLGAALASAGRPTDATVELTEAIRIEPRYAEAHNDLGLALSKLGRTEEAIEQFRIAVELRPDYVDAIASLGSALLLQREDEAGMRSLEQALRLDPDHADARTKLGLALAQRGDLDAAFLHLSRVVQLHPTYVAARQHLALVHYLRGEPDRARQELELVREAGGEPDPRLVRLLSVNASPSPHR